MHVNCMYISLSYVNLNTERFLPLRNCTFCVRLQDQVVHKRHLVITDQLAVLRSIEQMKYIVSVISV